MALPLPIDPIPEISVINLSWRIPVPVGLLAQSVALASLPLAVVPLSSVAIVTPSSLLRNSNRVYGHVSEFICIREGRDQIPLTPY